MLGLAPRITALHVVVTFLAFGAGWSWPVFTNFGIMRANGDAAGAASGVTQMGIYLGVFLGPLLTGWTIDEFGYFVDVGRGRHVHGDRRSDHLRRARRVRLGRRG